MEIKMHPWINRVLKESFRGATTWAAVAWTAEKLRKEILGIKKQAKGDSEKLRDDFVRSLGYQDKKQSKATLHEAISTAPEAMKRVVLEVSKGEIMEKKKKWSFFKVILVLGMVIAVAVFLLDRILPKPYKDEELEEAWNDLDEDNETDEVEEEKVERPMAAEAVAEKTEVKKAEVVEEKPKKKSTKKSSKKED